jgi:hypothetical protein
MFKGSEIRLGTDTLNYRREISMNLRMLYQFSREFLPMEEQTARISRIWSEFPQVIEVNYVAGRFFSQNIGSGN